MSNKLASTWAEAQPLLSQATEDDWRLPANTLMVSADHFRIDYAINPYMKDASGLLKVVNHDLAVQQWKNLKSKFESLCTEVHVLPGAAALPDMVFAANQSLVFWDHGEPHVIMSNMNSPLRRPEVAHFESWYQARGYKVHHLTTPDTSFEGNGDALLDPKFRVLWGGVGPRSNQLAYQEISNRFQIPVILLPLQCTDFYHLDTCFAVLGPDAVAIQSRAFTEESLKIISNRFSTVIQIDYDENIRSFPGNCHNPKGKDIVLHQGATKFRTALEDAGFRTHEVDTSEFMKSGGSVFCLKMMVF